MAELVSPGVSISVTDESFYAAAGTGTVPLLVIATAQDKSSPDGTGTAAYTTSANADKVQLITSQRELLSQYGNPIFKTSGGTALHGHELNEYGLQAAYSFLGLANRAYVLRADLDLDELAGSSSEPSVAPAAGSYWLDMASSIWGLKVWNGSAWVRQTVTRPGADFVSGTGEATVPVGGKNGDYAAVFVDSAGDTTPSVKFFNRIAGTWYHIGTSAWDSASGNDFQIANHTALPSTQSGGGALSSGDVLLQMSAPNNGTDAVVKIYEDAQFVTEDVFGSELSETAYSHYINGGVPNLGDLWADYSADDATIEFKRWNGTPTVIAQSSAVLTDDEIAMTNHTSGTVAFKMTVSDRDVVHGANGSIEVTFFGYDSADPGGNITVNEIVDAINGAIDGADSLARSDSLQAFNDNGTIIIRDSLGYDLRIEDTADVATFSVSDLNLEAKTYSNWEPLSYEASVAEITGTVSDGKLWYDSLVSNDHIDILYNNAGTWESYTGDVNIAASQPTKQSDGSSALSAGDLWIDSGDLENYPTIYKYSGTAWVEIDSADQESEDGILFGDFRSTTSALDSDAPNAALYPYNILAWNFRLSGGNVKQWDATNERWDNYSGLKADGTPYLLRKAQRAAIVRAMQSAVASNTDIRNESNRFNLIAAPGYPELSDEMITLATDRKETAFVIIDAPLRLEADATSIQNWASNSANATENGEDGLVSNYTYSAVYYPHGLTSDLAGNNIVVPASHIALRTLAYNDQVAFPWFAPAGFQRGVVTNASSVGYIDGASGEYTPVSLSEGQRDTLYINKMNPIAQFPGRGLAVFGQKTLSADASALDRVNVARLTVYIRERLDDIVRPFLFEPNDEVTRQNAKVTVDRFLGNLVTQRGLFDFVTVCDTTNNTPARIDRNELHIDIAIQPVKAVEFIYIPIRVQNTLGQTG